MANSALAHRNLFDIAEITASSSAASTPPSMLQNPHTHDDKWRGTGGTTDWVHAQWDTDQSADTFMIAGLPSIFLLTGTVRLQLSKIDGTPIYDSGTVAGIVDPDYGYAIHLLGQIYTTIGRAMWTFSQAGAAYIEAGRGFAGRRTEVDVNYSPGAQRGRKSNTKKTPSEAGQTYVRRSTFNPRVEEVSFGWIEEAQRWALHERIDLDNLDHTDILFIKDTASTNLGRDSIWGLADSTAVIQPFLAHPDLYSKAYRIEERG